jgi:MFS family permease
MRPTPSVGNEFRHGWRAVLGGAAGVATGTGGLPFFTFSLFIAPLAHAFGWSVTQIAASTLAKTLGSLATFGVAGRLADRYGARRVGLASLALTGISFLSFMWLTPSIWSFQIAWFVLSAVGAGTSPAIWTRGVSGWFQRRRGLAIGLVLLGTGISSALAPSLVAAAIAHGGWRMGYAALAAITALIGLPLVFAFFREAPMTTPEPSYAGPGPQGQTLLEALRRRAFWQIGAGLFLGGGALTAFIVHLLGILADRGLAKDGVGVASLLGVAVVAGRIGVGYLMDRVFAPYIALACFFSCAVAFVVVGAATVPITVAVGCAVLVGLVSGAEVDLLTYLTTRYFGLRAYTEICNWLLIAFTLGSGFTPPLAGYARERTGSYHLSLWAGAVILTVAAVLFGTLGKYTDQPQPATATS